MYNNIVYTFKLFRITLSNDAYTMVIVNYAIKVHNRIEVASTCLPDRIEGVQLCQ